MNSLEQETMEEDYQDVSEDETVNTLSSSASLEKLKQSTVGSANVVPPVPIVRIVAPEGDSTCLQPAGRRSLSEEVLPARGKDGSLKSAIFKPGNAESTHFSPRLSPNESANVNVKYGQDGYVKKRAVEYERKIEFVRMTSENYAQPSSQDSPDICSFQRGTTQDLTEDANGMPVFYRISTEGNGGIADRQGEAAFHRTRSER